MSHADDGTLHAYLDGQLNAVELAQLEAHLGECAACRARVEEERALIERARGLLTHAAPGERELPPFRHVRRRAVRPLPRWVPLAWAASVLVALGGGWLVRDRGFRGDTVLPAPTDEPATVALDADQPRQAVPRETPAPSTPAFNAPREAERARPHTGRDDRATQVKAAAQQNDPDARIAAESRAEELAERRAAADTGRGGRVGGVAAGAAAAPLAAAERPALPSGALDAIVVTTDAAAAWPLVSLDSARAILQSEPVAIAELPVRSVRASAAGAVLVEQPLDSTSTIRVFQRRADRVEQRLRIRGLARENAAARPGEATELLARYVGPLRVEIAGPLSGDSLSKLLERVRPIR